MIPEHLSPFANHLWQSTLFAGLAALLTLVLRKNRAQMRYWLWLAASAKFLIPFSLLVTLGSQLPWRTAPVVIPTLSQAVEQISQPFSIFQVLAVPGAPDTSTALRIAPVLLMGMWFCGFVVILWRWWARWRHIRMVIDASSPLPLETPIPVMSAPSLMEPGVFGVFRPVLLLPQGIADRLTPAQLRAILAHELSHVRRRDNLASAIHMVVEAVFWFHPLVWWIGARMVEERERACDEEVLRLGAEPQAYAEGILNVCKFYLESPLACASGVTGSDLKKRIEAIMTDRISYKLTVTRRLLLVAVGTMAVAGPILIGIMNAPRSRAQSKPGELTFEVASIKRSDPDSQNSMFRLIPGGGLNIANVPLRHLVAFAYDVQMFQISGGPGWVDSQRFDILAKPPQAAESSADLRQMTDDQLRLVQEQVRQRLQALLQERFQLAIHKDTKELPVYALVPAKNGPKLQESKESARGIRHTQMTRGQMNSQGATLEMLTRSLAGVVGRPVLDRTGLKGTYDFKLEWTPDPGGPGGPQRLGPGGAGEKTEAAAADVSGPSIFTAVQEQLGLKLESQKGPVETIIIDRVEKPSEN